MKALKAEELIQLSTKELAMLCHKAEYENDDLTIIDIMNECARREKSVANYYDGWFMEEYRATMKESHEKYGSPTKK